jgi:hypothetical protein
LLLVISHDLLPQLAHKLSSLLVFETMEAHEPGPVNMPEDSEAAVMAAAFDSSSNIQVDECWNDNDSSYGDEGDSQTTSLKSSSKLLCRAVRHQKAGLTARENNQKSTTMYMKMVADTTATDKEPTGGMSAVCYRFSSLLN